MRRDARTLDSVKTWGTEVTMKEGKGLPKIDKAVPIPANHGGKKYPFNEMEIGDSFWTDNPYVRQAASDYGSRNGQAFTCRKDGDGIRVWRVEVSW